MTQWSPQQDEAIKKIARWQRSGSEQVFRLFGYAGTGKTTLARAIARAADGKVAFAAFTGKAALVMRSKGCRGASTIHSLIYKVDDELEGIPRWVLNRDSEVKDCNLVIIDECSMVDETLGRDLLSFGVKVLVIGDPAQLPPVKGTGFFTTGTPDYMLTEVHRQARDNPIIRLSMRVREGERIPYGEVDGCRVIKREDLRQEEVLAAEQVLVGINRTRHLYNRRIRQLIGREDEMPVVDDRLVCLRNNKEKGLLNGGIWAVRDVMARESTRITMQVTPLDAGLTRKDAEVEVHPKFFTGQADELHWSLRGRMDEFDYGYALTVHKSQGSQWDNVLLFNESAAFREHAARHLYTGITRAAKTLTIVT